MGGGEGREETGTGVAGLSARAGRADRSKCRGQGEMKRMGVVGSWWVVRSFDVHKFMQQRGSAEGSRSANTTDRTESLIR